MSLTQCQLSVEQQQLTSVTTCHKIQPSGFNKCQ